jgi:NADH dehydrogenase [ubiquinone] 1 alpha subcomplex assembly factor 6
MALQPTTEQSYCADQVRRNDWDRFVCALFAPAEERPALFALLAFNVEIARTRAVVSERLLGEIRLQWWRDAIDALYRGNIAVLKHPVVEALKPAIETYALERAPFEAMIDSRSDELDQDPATDLRALETHARTSESNLIKLQMSVLGAVNEVTAENVAIAWTIAKLAPDRFAADARARLSAARTSGIDAQSLPALLHARLAELYIDRKQPSRLRRQLAVALAAWRGRF